MENPAHELLRMEEAILKEELDFYRNKMLVRGDLGKKEVLKSLQESPNLWLKRICNEYDMDCGDFGSRTILRCHLSPVQLTYVHAVTKFLCTGSSLKPFSTFAGKSAEMVFRNSINNLFNLFRIKKRIQINSKNFLYGGDGGGDFFIGNQTFDVKYRNESPRHGLILENRFLDNAEDDVILIQVTNSVNYKIAESVPDQEKSLPLALSGWTTIKDFKTKGKPINNGRDSLCLDDLNPIMDLLFLILEDQIDSESLFEYP